MFQVDPALALRLVSVSAEHAVRLVGLNGRALIVECDEGRDALAAGTAVLRGELRAFDRTWQWSRLRVAPTEGGLLALSSDDACDEANLWDVFFEARRTRALAGAPPYDVDSSDPPFRGHFTPEKAARRMAWLRTRTGHDLPALTAPRLDASRLKGNVEHFAGSIEIPVGLAGPLLFHGEHVRGHVVAPLATTEGALVSSTSRGAKALTLAGGVTTHIVHQRMTRAPVFVAKDLRGAVRLAAWLVDHEEEIRSHAEAASRHARLVRLEPIQIGRYVHARFVYETGDAAGQNMATFCTWRACAWIRAQLVFVRDVDVTHCFIEGNTSGDKKVTSLSAHSGRGVRVMAEAFVSKNVLRRALNVSPEVLLEALEAGGTGSTYAGMFGANVNVANVIAALFVATGQDIACVHESSVAQFHLKAHGDGVAATLLLHALVVGSVGGGTWLPTQSDALRVLGCFGPGRARRLAEIICGFALGLELSTLAAVAAGDFTAAHEVLGRPKDDAGLRDEDLDRAFFEARLAESKLFGDDPVRVEGVRALDAPEGDSVLGQLVAGSTRKKIGVFPYELHVRIGDRQDHLRIALKSKVLDTEVIRAMTSLTRMCGDSIATLYEHHGADVGFRGCHVRELRIAELRDPRVTATMPRTYFTYAKAASDADPREIHLLGMEYLEGMRLMGTADDLDAWQAADIEVALDGIAAFHAVHLGRTKSLESEPWLDVITPQRMQRLAPLFAAVVERNRVEYPEIYTGDRARRMLAWLGDARTHLEAFEGAPRTLVHNDFNPRNIALRPVPGQAPRLCAFDWELATIHVPQRDVCELLAWVLPPGTALATRDRFAEYYRTRLEHHAGVPVPKSEFFSVFDSVSMEYAVSRLGMYTVAHGFRAFEWLPRILEAHFAWLEEANG